MVRRVFANVPHQDTVIQSFQLFQLQINSHISIHSKDGRKAKKKKKRIGKVYVCFMCERRHLALVKWIYVTMLTS